MTCHCLLFRKVRCMHLLCMTAGPLYATIGQIYGVVNKTSGGTSSRRTADGGLANTKTCRRLAEDLQETCSTPVIWL